MKAARIRITEQFLHDILAGKFPPAPSDMPKNFRILGAYSDHERGNDMLILTESEEFEDIPDGQVLPERMVWFGKG